MAFGDWGISPEGKRMADLEDGKFNAVLNEELRYVLGHEFVRNTNSFCFGNFKTESFYDPMFFDVSMNLDGLYFSRHSRFPALESCSLDTKKIPCDIVSIIISSCRETGLIDKGNVEIVEFSCLKTSGSIPMHEHSKKEGIGEVYFFLGTEQSDANASVVLYEGTGENSKRIGEFPCKPNSYTILFPGQSHEITNPGSHPLLFFSVKFKITSEEVAKD